MAVAEDADVARTVHVETPAARPRAVMAEIDVDVPRHGGDHGTQFGVFLQRRLSVHDAGAYIGEISGAFLAKLGCAYVTVGHSERREYHHEDDAVVNAKVQAAFRHGVTPIFCCGEGLQIRQAGTHVEHVLAQVEAGLKDVPVEQAKNVVVAYEPIWAIGTGEVATPEDAQEVCAAIRTKLAELYSGDVADGIRVLYGGSVKSGNVAAIMAKEDVDGALVGGASIDPVEFAAICRFRDHLQTS